MNGNFASPCLENKALDLNDIADIPFLEFGELFFSDFVNADIDLHSARAVTDINEVCLAHITAAHHSAADADILIFKLLETLVNLGVMD